MVQVRVAGVAVDSMGQHVILLKPLSDAPGVGSIVPIWIGAQEATSILVAVENAVTPRPLAHDLMTVMLQQLEAQVTRVEVTRITDGTFFAEITVAHGDQVLIIDARPSDAIALASRVGAAIWVADAVIEEAGMPDILDEDDAEVSVDEFKRFLDEVDPEDFRG
ncbi:bifunctional nuclease family protein [Microbacterium schleiferi]|uniref:Bifunctional nuclease family protein n=1 Tax=Microbacterium schleiferi TaxID=69362 RepID=A0A7S8RH88_9MICO|nr:bifunctional nuclease family protein [Microbacterium schleiferi]QPE04876.1 bifunctional nuclease family protein [Microbacterium schleiferi]